MRKTMLAILAALPLIATSGASLDPIAARRLEAMSNQKKLLSADTATIPGKVIYTYRQSGITWSETNNVRKVAGELPPAKYSTLKLLTVIADAGRYAEVKTALQTQTLPNGMPYWDALIAAQFLVANDPRLLAGIELAVQAGIATRDEIAALLKKAED